MTTTRDSRNWREWNKWAVAGIIAAAAFVPAFNYLVDPFDVFGSRLLKPGYSLNQRYLKVEHVLADKARYNAFLVGSSAIGLLDPQKASEMRPGMHYYNLGFLGGTHSEVYKVLRALKAAGVQIDEVTVGIDVFPFVQSDTPGDMLHHPLVEGISRTTFFTRYLFASTVWQGLNKIEHNFRQHPSIVYDIDHSGQYFLVEYDRQIAADHDAYISTKFRATNAAVTPKRVPWVDSRFDEFEAFVQWLNRERIEAVFFIHPFHHSRRMLFPDEAMAEFRKRIEDAVGHPVKDYSGTRSITDDDRNYYDKRHYRKHVADFVLQDVLSR